MASHTSCWKGNIADVLSISVLRQKVLSASSAASASASTS